MEERLFLYLLTCGLGDYYVIAKNPTDAETYLRLMLNKADYGFEHQRAIKNIKVLAKEIKCFPADKPFFSEDKDYSLLLIAN
jgi:hypothetical protein